jgi:hypothetical protein
MVYQRVGDTAVPLLFKSMITFPSTSTNAVSVGAMVQQTHMRLVLPDYLLLIDNTDPSS